MPSSTEPEPAVNGACCQRTFLPGSMSGISIEHGAMMEPGRVSTPFYVEKSASRPIAIQNPVLPLSIVRASGTLWVTTEMGGEQGFNPHKQVKGRKRNVMTDTLGLILFVVVCAASIADSDGAEYILNETEGQFPRLRTILVDQGYKSWLVEFAKRWFNIIVDSVNRPLEQHEFVVQPQRWKIERTFGWLDWSRILGKEYERTTESSASDVYLASIRLMLKRLACSPK